MGVFPNGWSRGHGIFPPSSEMAEARKKEKEKRSWLSRGKGGSQKKKLGVKITETSFVEGQGASSPPPASTHQPTRPSDRPVLKSTSRSQSVGGRPSNPEGKTSTKHEEAAVTSSSQVRPPTGPAVNPQPASQGSPPHNLEGDIPMKDLKVMLVDTCKLSCSWLSVVSALSVFPKFALNVCLLISLSICNTQVHVKSNYNRLVCSLEWTWTCLTCPAHPAQCVSVCILYTWTGYVLV